jgi:predicted dehydrogenase
MNLTISSAGTSRNSNLKPIRLAIVGAGAITRNGHLPAALRSPHFEVCALVDKKLETAQELARKYSLSQDLVFESLDRVLDRSDAVLIATPPSSHFPLAQQALNREIPVLLEKPFTITSADANALCELVRARNTALSVGYFTRQFPSVPLLKHLLDTGYLGRVLSFDYQFGASGGWETASGFNMNRDVAGGGVLIDTGTHFLDKMLYWFGVPRSVTYTDDSYGGPEANCRAEFLFSGEHGEFSGTLALSKTVALRNRLVIETDRYTCKLGDRQTHSITLSPKNEPELTLEVSARQNGKTTGEPDYMQLQLEEFAAVIRNGAQPSVDCWSAAESVKLIESMYASRLKLMEPWSILERFPAREARLNRD